MRTWFETRMEKFITPSSSGASQQGCRRGGSRRLEADCKKDDLTLGISGRDRQHVAVSTWTLMSAPCAFAPSRLPHDPGTRIMSPKEVKITPGWPEMAMASSTRPIGITHTGQPGPCTSSTEVGRRCSIPWR